MSTATLNRQQQFVLRFPPLQAEGRSLCFPCNEAGEVPLGHLSDGIRNNYFLARVGIGRAFCRPRVEPLQQPAAQAAAQPRDAYLAMRPRPTALA